MNLVAQTKKSSYVLIYNDPDMLILYNIYKGSGTAPSGQYLSIQFDGKMKRMSASKVLLVDKFVMLSNLHIVIHPVIKFSGLTNLAMPKLNKSVKKIMTTDCAFTHVDSRKKVKLLDLRSCPIQQIQFARQLRIYLDINPQYTASAAPVFPTLQLICSTVIIANKIPHDNMPIALWCDLCRFKQAAVMECVAYGMLKYYSCYACAQHHAVPHYHRTVGGDYYIYTYEKSHAFKIADLSGGLTYISMSMQNYFKTALVKNNYGGSMDGSVISRGRLLRGGRTVNDFTLQHLINTGFNITTDRLHYVSGIRGD